MTSRRSGIGSATVAVLKPVRVAIYTRRSTVEAADAGLTAVDRQRDAGEAFVRAQQHQNWVALPDRFDDGGFTGANTDRPGLKRLMAAVDAGEVDIVLVSRLDRLTRSLADFVRLHEYLQERGVHLASIAESIDTGSPAGRMMVSLLAAFGQYERELIAARTKDKLAAARRKGRFTGGALILGYDRHPDGGRLVVNELEAETVRAIFRLFLELRSLAGTVTELNRRGWTLKRWLTKDGRFYGGGRFDKSTLRSLLTNYTYIGKVNFQGTVYPGEHKGIVPASLFKDVQAVLAEYQRAGLGVPNAQGALLRGLLRCNRCDRAMAHQWTRSHSPNRVFRYYVCQRALNEGRAACPAGRVSALEIEKFIVDRIRSIGRDAALQKEVFDRVLAQLEAERRDLQKETNRLERERDRAQREVDRLVASTGTASGSAQNALMAALSKAQEDVDLVNTRVQGLADLTAQSKARRVDETDLQRVLVGFDEVWDALLVPERERVLRLIIEQIQFDGVDGELTYTLSPTGMALLAAEGAI